MVIEPNTAIQTIQKAEGAKTFTKINSRTVRPFASRLRNNPRMGAYTIKDVYYRTVQSAYQPSSGAKELSSMVFCGHLVIISAKDSTSATTGAPFTAQVTRGDAEALGITDGDTVYVRATRIPPIGGQAQTPGVTV